MDKHGKNIVIFSHSCLVLINQEANETPQFPDLDNVREYKKKAWSEDNQFYAATEQDSQIQLMSLSDREIDLDSGALIPSYNSEPIITLKLNGLAGKNGHY